MATRRAPPGGGKAKPVPKGKPAPAVGKNVAKPTPAFTGEHAAAKPGQTPVGASKPTHPLPPRGTLDYMKKGNQKGSGDESGGKAGAKAGKAGGPKAAPEEANISTVLNLPVKGADEIADIQAGKAEFEIVKQR